MPPLRKAWLAHLLSRLAGLTFLRYTRQTRLPHRQCVRRDCYHIKEQQTQRPLQWSWWGSGEDDDLSAPALDHRWKGLKERTRCWSVKINDWFRGNWASTYRRCAAVPRNRRPVAISFEWDAFLHDRHQHRRLAHWTPYRTDDGDSLPHWWSFLFLYVIGFQSGEAWIHGNSLFRLAILFLVRLHYIFYTYGSVANHRREVKEMMHMKQFVHKLWIDEYHGHWRRIYATPTSIGTKILVG